MEILAVYNVVDVEGLSWGSAVSVWPHTQGLTLFFNTICSDPFHSLYPSWEKRKSALAVADIIDHFRFQMLAFRWVKHQIPSHRP